MESEGICVEMSISLYYVDSEGFENDLKSNYLIIEIRGEGGGLRIKSTTPLSFNYDSINTLMCSFHATSYTMFEVR